MAGLRLGLGLGIQPRRAGGGAAPVPLSISGTPVLSATEGEAYAGFTASAAGGTAPYVYSLVGTWPAGISINADTGAVSGTPTEDGSFAGLSVRVTDAALATDDLDAFTLEVEAAPPSVTYLGRITASGNSLDIGTADPNCLIVCAMQHKREGAARTLTSLSIGGTNGTIHGQVGDATNGEAVAIVSRVVTGGGSTAFSWVLSGAVADAGIDVFRIDGLVSTTPSDTMFPAAGNNPSGTIDFPANGVVIGAAAGNGQNAFTWTGLAEETDANFGGTAVGRYSSAKAGPTSLAAGTTVGVTSASAAEVVGAVAWA